MILTHGANSLVRGGGDYVEIGGKKYPFVQIGRQLWIVYNLDYSDANIPIGGGLSSSVPKAYYYDQDEATNGWNGRKNNLLYNTNALNYLVQNSSTIFPNGWRVCSNSDMESLIKFDGGASVAGIKLAKGDLDWQSASWNGTDDFGFSWLPGGTRWGSDGRFATIGEEAALITIDRFIYYTPGDGKINYQVLDNGSADLSASVNIRLCKDATVNIGGRDYPTTKIGNQIWLAENLDYKFAGCGIGGSTGHQSTPHAWYYDNDEATYGVSGYKCGLLYNIAAVNYIEQNKSLLLPEGWHIPSAEECNTLISNVGGSAIGSPKLRSVSVPYAPSWNGTDDYGFSSSPTGNLYSSGIFSDITIWANYWTNNTNRALDMSMNKPIGISPMNTDSPLAIRLVKDAT